MDKLPIIMYQTEDGKTKIDVKVENETVWLTQAQMAELFDKAKSTINEHISNIFKEGELDENSVIRNFRTTASDGKTYDTNFYNLDVIISVGYRVHSLRGTQFRIWANKVLKEYLIKGFAMNDDLLKNAGGGNYFKELLERIRDIRSSEKVLYRQVLDLFATSIDYDGKSETAIKFFKAMQNKFHYATHGNTASEIVFARANAELPFMGLTNFKGTRPTKNEILVAKNYLNEKELAVLNRLVSAYFDIAEIQAIEERPMYMKDWIKELDDFISINHRELLNDAGKISHIEAQAKALEEYKKYNEKPFEELTQVEKDFLTTIKRTEHLLENKKSTKK